MIVSGSIAGGGLALLKLAKALKGLKLLGAAGKSAAGLLAKKKAAGLATSAAAKKVAAKMATNAARPAGSKLGTFLTNTYQRAGYSPTELALNLLPDVGMNLLYADQIPGDPVDKALAIGSNIVVGQGLSGLGRAAVNSGRIGRTAARTNERIKQLAAQGKKVDPRYFALQDKLNKRTMLPQTMEIGGMMVGGLAAYPAGEHLQKAKSYISGDGYLSPTDKIFVDQDEQMQAQMLAAYEAGLASGAQGGYAYDPYSGDVPVGGYYGY